MGGPSGGRLAGRVALVTGAGSGIGEAACLAFAREGARVVLAGRREAMLTAVAARIEAEGGSALCVPTDVDDAGSVRDLLARAQGWFGRLDCAFNNAGRSVIAPIEQATVEDYDRAMRTNVRGVWLLVRHEVGAMRTAGRPGSIVNTSSIAATGGMPGLSIYAATKGALDAMVRSLAGELGPAGIRINNVSPGVVRTPMTEAVAEIDRGVIAGHAALRRMGEPEEIGDVAVWLCTDAARYVTGQSILVDGGFNLAGLR